MNQDKYYLFMKKCLSNHPYDDNHHILKLYEIKQGLRIIARKYQIQRILLFGSYAYGNPDRFSDLNLLVDYGRCHGLDCIGFIDETEQYFRKSVDVVNRKSISLLLKTDIGERKIVVYDELW
ncbi:hypothetical protein SDC9_211502 [bioreactor metagenome]|uniref:Polymerase nucleotidyl transferase domain-containing protein n=1 Tax=bioreactor metagenome TaxID=1076179 RepID=A0A645JJZ0_9ZZZZ